MPPSSTPPPQPSAPAHPAAPPPKLPQATWRPSSFPEYHAPPQKRSDPESFRTAASEIALVGVLIVGGLYFFGSSLNEKAQVEEEQQFVTHQLEEASSDLSESYHAETASASEIAELPDAEAEAAVADIDLLQDL